MYWLPEVELNTTIPIDDTPIYSQVWDLMGTPKRILPFLMGQRTAKTQKRLTGKNCTQ